MTVATFWSESWTVELVNHLWQSSIVAGAAWLIAFGLRKNHARTRYWVWMAASLKFLLPFSLLIDAGEWLRSWVSVSTVPSVTSMMERISQPFPQALVLDASEGTTATHHAMWLPTALLTVWICGVLVVAIRFGRGWWSVYAAQRGALPLDLAADVPVLLSPAKIEPGIVGIVRPVLLMPEGILERLSPEQCQAVLAHELCHIRYHDNLIAAIHMFVETAFWFHPLVWWIGKRMVEERERACDEEVLRLGNRPRVYAEGILNVCKLYVESPLSCVPGVTGSNLKRRIEAIIRNPVRRNLSFGSRFLLAAACLVLNFVNTMTYNYRCRAL